jgi:hypothetical protein
LLRTFNNRHKWGNFLTTWIFLSEFFPEPPEVRKKKTHNRLKEDTANHLVNGWVYILRKRLRNCICHYLRFSLET